MRLILLAAAGILLAGPVAASAQGCDNATSQSALSQCASEAYQAVDTQLNDTYREIQQRLDGDDDLQGKLQQAQRSWIGFRDAQCAFANANAEGGSVYPMLQSRCMADLTNARLDELNALLACEEGDMSCPVPAE